MCKRVCVADTGYTEKIFRDRKENNEDAIEREDEFTVSVRGFCYYDIERS